MKVIIKKNITFCIVLFISMINFAQQGINYKAIIKDANGNVLANQNVSIQFRILDALSGGTIEYQGTHDDVMTDANGIAIASIGEGLQSLSYSFFNDIDWGSHAHYLQVGIDITNGTNYEDMGTSEFKAVPYALYAANASTGLEQINENGNTGWRLLGSDPLNYNDIGDNAVDLSISESPSSNLGASDFASFASGYHTQASGAYSVAMGNNTIASRFASTAFGQFNVDNPLAIFSVGDGSIGGGRSNALTLTVYNDFIVGNSQIDDDPNDINDNTKFFFSGSRGALRAGRVSVESGDEWNDANTGLYSAAFGVGTMASGNYSTAIGNKTIASSTSSFATGRLNVDDPDALLMVGNGVSTNFNDIRNNAFVVKRDGNVVVDGEIQQTSTGSANMIPIAYGTIESNGNVLSGTGNFTASVTNNIFSITVNGETLTASNSSCSIVPYSTSPRTSSIIHSGGDLRVYIFNSSGTQVVTTFQFVIYRL